MISWVQLAKAALISLVLTLTAFAGSKLNLFGFEDAGNITSDDVFQEIQAGSYGADRRGQDRVRVVSLDERGIEALRQSGWTGWPPGFENLGILFEDMAYSAGAPPRAVFADLVITGGSIADEAARARFGELTAVIGELTQAETWAARPACRADPLVRLACMIEAGGTPIILAKPDALEQDGLTWAQRRLDEVALLSPILVNARAYPLANDYGGARPEGVYGFDLYPAAALYAAHCLHARIRLDEPEACPEPMFAPAAEAARAALAGEPVSAGGPPEIWSTPVAVLWGDRPAARQAELTARVSSGALEPCRERANVLARAAQRMVNALPRSAACAYAFNIGYDRLVAGFGLEEADYDFILADRLILVGSHMLNSDWVPTPVHGQLPGVHYHAMALDNLLEFGPDYRQVNTAWLSVDDILKSGLTFILLLTVIVAVMARNTILEDIRPQWKARPPLWATATYYLLLVVLVFGLTLLVAWAGFDWWKRAVINWLGILFLAFGVLIMAARLTFITDVGGPLRFVDAWAKKLDFGDRTLSRRRPPPAEPAPEPPPPRPRSRKSASSPAPARARARRKPADAPS